MLIIRQPPDILTFGHGRLADDAEIERLQEHLRTDPEFRDARLALMIATRASQALRAAQVYWFAEHEPRTFLAHYGWMATAGEGMTAGEFYEEGKRRWLLAADARRDEPDVVENAAWFMIQFEPHRGAQLLDDRSRQEPDPEWSRRAVSYLEHASELHPREGISLAARALEAGYRVFRLEKSVERCIDLLPTMETCAKRAAMAGAVRPLELAEASAGAWRRAGQNLRPQLAETVKGLLSLAEGDTRRGESHFRRANDVHALPSDALVSFAAELVASGAGEIVLPAIQAWERRFQDCAKAAMEWANAIRAGTTAVLPTFPPKRGN
jgi:hypothetical protein